MTKIPVVSSNISSIGYDNSILEITFLTGDTYQYDNVPTNVYQGLMNASSHGKYLNEFVKNNYSVRKI